MLGVNSWNSVTTIRSEMNAYAEWGEIDMIMIAVG